MGGGAAFSSQAGTAASLGSVEAISSRSTMEGQVEAGQAAARRAWKNATGHAWKGTQSTASAGETNHAEPPFVVLEGMDPNTCLELKIKLVGNRKKARKEVRCWSLEKFVDSDLINIKDLVESIVVVCPPGYLEVVHLQYYDNVMKTFPEVTCDQDLMSMFAKHKATKVVTMFIQYCDPFEPYVPITEWEIDEQMQQDNNTKLDDDDYLRNPLPENEHVGVDDEAMYLEDEAANPFSVVVYSEKEQDKDFVPEDDSEDGSEDEGVSDMEIDEDEELVGHEATHIPSFEYDKEDPPMTEGSTYLYPPLLKATAGRPRTERYKGCSENKKKKGMHQCPICKDYGHHWHRCKKGNPEDIAAMMAIRGPPKKKAKTTKSAQSSIVPTEDDAPAASMSFPPSQTLETTCKKKGKHVTSGSGGSKCQSLETTSKTKESHDNSNSGPSKRRMSRSGSNQPEPNAIDKPPLKKAKPTRKKKDTPKVIPMLPFDSPAMGTRSKRVDPASPPMSTRSKRRLSL